MLEKIRTSNKIPTKQIKKIVHISIKYTEATRQGPTQVQIW